MEFFTTCGAIPVYVSDSEKGDKTVVLLHGYLETMAVWDDFAKRLSSSVRVIRIDLPGHGLSGSHPVCNTMDFSAKVVYEVLQKCGAGKAVVTGHSMGGYVAQALAANYPEAVGSLALFHSTPHPDSEEKQKNRDREIALIRTGKLSLLAKQNFPHMFAEEHIGRLKECLIELEELAEIHEPQGIIACLEGMKIRPDRNHFLATFKKPLLFVFGEKDYYISTETAKNITKKIPQAQVLWLRDSGHSGFLEEPEAVASTFMEFIKQ